ncbi:MAG TPA: ammonium transporter [Acidimicrobiales bacterium]|nr:ammonium transporter [Acidimicrobiales bacterium]
MGGSVLAVTATGSGSNPGDTAWVLVSAGLVLFMTPGLALFYGGMVRAKNVLGIIMQNFFCMGIVSVLWVLIGFTLAFGPDAGHGLIGGLDMVGLRHIANGVPGFHLTIPPLAFMVFQMMFAIITPALITGATADRLRFTGFVVFVSVWLLLVYAPIAHWSFSPGGWLYHRGVLDFAGGTVVEINSGFSSLAAAMVVGRRRGWPEELMSPHSLPFTLLGAGILWFGWFGFNAGSALGASGVATQALVNTQLAAAAGLLGWIFLEAVRADGKPTTLGAASGAVAGMVAITPCAGFVGTLPSIAIGFAAGIVCLLAVRLKFRFRYDDSLDVVAVHGIGGIVGMVLLGVFAAHAINPAGSNGLASHGGLHLLGQQLLATVVSMAYAFGATYLIARVVHSVIGLRVSPDDEAEGLDTSQHAESAYAAAGLGRIQ